MPDWLKEYDWKAIGASVLLLLAAILAIHGAGLDATAPYQQQYSTDEAQPAQVSVQDIAAQSIAKYTKVLAWFTVVLAAASVGQGILIWRQVSLARDEFNAVHRPRIEILRVETVDVEIRDAPESEVAKVFVYDVQMFFANKGTGKATTRQFEWALLFEAPVTKPMFRTRDLKKTILASGERGSQSASVTNWLNSRSDRDQ